MIDISLKAIYDLIGNVKEGDIIVVEHSEGVLKSICYKDDTEKNRRIKIITEMMLKSAKS